MTGLDWLMGFGLVMAAFPSILAMVNTRRLHSAPPIADAVTGDELVSCCIPARNEEENLEACVKSLLDGGHQQVVDRW